jgi:carbonic anhydrase
MSALTHLFAQNRAWAENIKASNPGFFADLAHQQSPEYLWIGCSDSRVPANQITGLQPGEVFVHRNIANVVAHSDLNCLAVLQFAVDVLKIKHIIVCGHHGCSGVGAALRREKIGLADNWLRHVRDVCDQHAGLLEEIADPARRADCLCELNAIAQVMNVCQTTIVRDAWERGQALTVHGWVYGLQDGLLRDLHTSIADPAESASAHVNALSLLAQRQLAPVQEPL